MMDILLAGTNTPIAEIVLRLSLAALFSAVLGFEREVRNHAAGLRTHMLTALAAATFTLLTMELHAEAIERSGESAADPIRIVQAVTAGVAFLAAGAIIQARGRVQGLTTGAGMWLAGAIGLACGIGYYAIATIATVLGLVILALLRVLERHIGSQGDEPAARQGD